MYFDNMDELPMCRDHFGCLLHAPDGIGNVASAPKKTKRERKNKKKCCNDNVRYSFGGHAAKTVNESLTHTPDKLTSRQALKLHMQVIAWLFKLLLWYPETETH